ncbi:hypothetical protein AB0O01_08755 [Streptomyces sp. NPDC093252]|uniref:hypothetical protein n=1 Tax=Streptomyces sp. NPDC093252 TaxID=3154980 RepID=UPI003426F266
MSSKDVKSTRSVRDVRDVRAIRVERVTHALPGHDPAGYALALEVAGRLHGPATRAPELAPPGARPGPHRTPARRRRALRD